MEPAGKDRHIKRTSKEDGQSSSPVKYKNRKYLLEDRGIQHLAGTSKFWRDIHDVTLAGKDNKEELQLRSC